MTSGGFVIIVTNNSLNDSKEHSLESSNYFKDLTECLTSISSNEKKV